MNDPKRLTALLTVAKRALAQDDTTPADDRLCTRTLLAEAVAVLEQMAPKREVTA